MSQEHPTALFSHRVTKEAARQYCAIRTQGESEKQKKSNIYHTEGEKQKKDAHREPETNHFQLDYRSPPYLLGLVFFS
jgi:hypothetical protein